MDEALHRALRSGATLITANRRQARTLALEYARRRQAEGAVAWPSPDILTWRPWLSRLWEQWRIDGTDAPPMLLTAQQAEVVWESVIAASPQGKSLLQPQRSARLAHEAWGLLHDWELRVPFSPADCDQDAHLFQQWAEAYRHRCEQAAWLDEAVLPARLIQGLEAGELEPPHTLLLYGFEEWTPVQRRLLDALQKRSCEVRICAPAKRAGAVRRLACADSEAEMAAAAHWAADRLAVNPGASIGIVVPRLEDLRESIAAILDDVLRPAALLPGEDAGPRPWNISLGQMLSDWPLVRAALLLLELVARARLDLQDLGWLLRSPFIEGGETESMRRALLDARLRELGDTRVSWRSLRWVAGQDDKPWHCPQLVELLDEAVHARAALPARQGPGQWAPALWNLLKTLGWTAGRTLNSDEYQTARRLQEMLRRAAGLEAVTGPMDLTAFLDRLRGLCSRDRFQPEAATAPVQVLGLMEAAGQNFDHLWIMGLDDEYWPPPMRPNPFIPIQLQRRRGLPHASPERELAYARDLQAGLIGSADEVVLSHPRREGDRELRPSPLLADVAPMQGADCSASAQPYRERLHAAHALEPLDDDPAPAFQGGEAPGGAGLFGLQAACPFRAFAELRLGARALETPQSGLDARARGSLVHAVLDRIWAELRDQRRLLALDEESLQALVEHAVEAAIEDRAPHHPGTFTARFRQLEQERLTRLALEWLELERQREPFMVEEREREHRIEVAGLRVRLRADRVDVGADGRRLVIDYKTGRNNSPNGWFGERPDAPQLPLYGAFADHGVDALAFGQVVSGRTKLQGLGDGGTKPAPGINPFWKNEQGQAFESWEALLEHWRAVLAGLAEEFRDGFAAVQPKNGLSTCRYCQLTPLCRVNEWMQEQNGEERDD
jgi:probable DNA repair protein